LLLGLPVLLFNIPVKRLSSKTCSKQEGERRNKGILIGLPPKLACNVAPKGFATVFVVPGVP
jgi:hypothetical protein